MEATLKDERDLLSATGRITTSQRDLQLFKAIVLYRLKDDFIEADKVLSTLVKNEPLDFEV